MLLLYLFELDLYTLPDVFTFHYASTLSPCFFICCNYYIIFTFHYASTLSSRDIPKRLQYSHLHSTMLLLYPNFIRISLCSFQFTFHYASTLSEQATHSAQRIFHLHSTMLLLYLIAAIRYTVNR